MRRGAFVSGALWRDVDNVERFRLRAMAIVLSRPGDALSHHAAVAVHRLPLWPHDPERLDLVTLDELLAEVAVLTPHEGRARALECVLRMDERCESPGESRTRLVVQDLGLQHESQVELRDDEGRLVARVDLLVEGVAVEFDGRLKYRAGDADPDDADAVGRVVWLEKRREDGIRRLGHPVERVVWSELDRPGLIGRRIRQARRLVTARPRGVGGEPGSAPVTA